jgi:hypothetical protein
MVSKNATITESIIGKLNKKFGVKISRLFWERI